MVGKKGWRDCHGFAATHGHRVNPRGGTGEVWCWRSKFKNFAAFLAKSQTILLVGGDTK